MSRNKGQGKVTVRGDLVLLGTAVLGTIRCAPSGEILLVDDGGRVLANLTMKYDPATKTVAYVAGAKTFDELEGAVRHFLRLSGREESRAHKYNAVSSTVDGIRFDSKREACRYHVLQAMVQGGLITGLRTQVSFDLAVRGQVVCRYVADFVYAEGGRSVVEDAKGMKTPVYRIKKKLMLACHGIEIQEV